MSWLSKAAKKIVGEDNYNKVKGAVGAVAPFVDPGVSLLGGYGDKAQSLAMTNLKIGATGAALVGGWGFGGQQFVSGNVPSMATDIYGSIADLAKTYINAKFQSIPPSAYPTGYPAWGVGMPVPTNAPIPSSTVIYGGQPDTRSNQAIPASQAPIIIDRSKPTDDNKTLLMVGVGFGFLVLIMGMMFAGRK